MINNHVYVPSLLRLANDVEEHPGPRTLNDVVNPTYSVHADVHQGNELMFGVNAGKQCVAMSLCAIVYKEIKSVNIWDRMMLNSILIFGNNLYSIISQSVNKSYLLLTDVPEFVDIDNHSFNVQYSDSFSGAVHMSQVSLPYVTLEHALNEVFISLHYNSCLLTIGMNTVAIMMPFPGVFKVFDSHSRDVLGRPSAQGYCVLISVEGIDNLEEYFRLTSRSNVMTPFELKGVKCIHFDNADMDTESREYRNRKKRTRKQNETTEQRAARLAKMREYNNSNRAKRQNETTEKRAARLAKMREYNNSNRAKRQNETTEQKEARLAKMREYNNSIRAKAQNETTEQRETRLAKVRKHSNSKKAKRQNETTEQKEARLAKMREYNNSIRAKAQNEMTEQRETRLAKVRKHSNSKKAKSQNETTEQREARLAKVREYKNSIKKKQTHETKEQREARLTKERERKRASGKRASFQKQNKTKGNYSSHPVQEGSYNPVSNYFRNENIDELTIVRKFHNTVSARPLYICTCCHQLWYKHSVSPADRLRLVNPEITKYLQSVRSVDDIEWICKTCNNHLKKGKVPPCAIANGMKFPEKPLFFDLNELECRLIAPRLAFQKIFQAPRGGQLKITGNVVNVPADVNSTVSMLPRLPDETGTIKVQLKRRLQYKSSALSLNIRPHKVMQAAAWLVNTSPLYEDEGITIDPNWLTSLQLSVDETCGSIETQSDACDKTTPNIPEDQWSEDEAEIPAGTTDSMLTTSDFVSDNEKQEIYNFAPGEGNKPLSVFRDQFSEEMAYPGIFLGQKRPDEKERLRNVHYSEIFKSELRRSDRRAAMCVENIFFKAKKLQMKFLIGQSQIALRKNKMGNRILTAGVLKSTEGLQSLINHDDGFRFLKTLRGSPPYFEKAKKDLFAMI